MTAAPTRLLYWMLAVAGAVLALMGASAAASSGAFDSLVAERAGRKPVPNKFSNNRSGRAIITVKNALPGKQARGRIVIANVGSNPIKKVLLTQDQVKNTGIGSALQLQIYDVSAKRCLYPRPKLPKPRPGKKPLKEPTVCKAWMPFKGGRALTKLQVPSIKGAVWKRKEKHAIDVRWRLLPTSPNSDQNKTASFRLIWRASA